MRHVTALQLCAFLDDALVGSPDDQTARHLATCTPCRIRYELWCHVDDSVRELLGEVPDEHAMEQWSSWVEIAVTADRKGLPAPEFAALRLPLTTSPPPRPPMEPLPFPALPPMSPLPMTPPPAARESTARMARPTIPSAPPGPTLGAGSPPPRPPLPYAGDVRVRTSGPMPPALHGTPSGDIDGPLPFGLDVPAAALPPAYAQVPVATGAARAPFPTPPQLARAGAYARMPKPPSARFPKGWLVFVVLLLLGAGTALALPYVCERFGWPLPKWPILTAILNAEHDALARRAAVAGAESAASGPNDGSLPHEVTSRPAGGKHSTSKPRTGDAAQHAERGSEPPDASILFDLPAIEPEDAEPEQANDHPAEHARPHETSAHREASKAGSRLGRSGWSQLCGEVRNTQGVPIEGARVSIAEPDLIARTDRSGRFCIACPPGKRTVRILAAGRAPAIRTVELGRETLETRFTLDVAN